VQTSLLKTTKYLQDSSNSILKFSLHFAQRGLSCKGEMLKMISGTLKYNI